MSLRSTEAAFNPESLLPPQRLTQTHIIPSKLPLPARRLYWLLPGVRRRYGCSANSHCLYVALSLKDPLPFLPCSPAGSLSCFCLRTHPSALKSNVSLLPVTAGFLPKQTPLSRRLIGSLTRTPGGDKSIQGLSERFWTQLSISSKHLMTPKCSD